MRRVQEKCVGSRVEDLKHLGVEEELLVLENALFRPRVCGSGFRVQGLGFRVQGLGFRVWSLGFRV